MVNFAANARVNYLNLLRSNSSPPFPHLRRHQSPPSIQENLVLASRKKRPPFAKAALSLRQWSPIDLRTRRRRPKSRLGWGRGIAPGWFCWRRFLGRAGVGASVRARRLFCPGPRHDALALRMAANDSARERFGEAAAPSGFGQAPGDMMGPSDGFRPTFRGVRSPRSHHGPGLPRRPIAV